MTRRVLRDSKTGETDGRILWEDWKEGRGNGMQQFSWERGLGRVEDRVIGFLCPEICTLY